MWLELFLLTCLILWLVYKRLTSSYNRWDSADIPSVKPAFPFGSHSHIMLGTKHDAEVMADLGKKYKGARCIGMHVQNTPLLAVLDFKLAKQILINDFDHFVDRPQAFFGFDFDPEKPSKAKYDLVWERAIFGLKGEQWRQVRATFSPIFTSGKMRLMSHVILDMQKRLINELDQSVGSPFDLKTKLGKFSMDSIASCAFGVDAQSFTNPNSQFVYHASQVFIRTVEDRLRYIVQLVPGVKMVLQSLNIPMFKGDQSKFFISVIEDTIRQRRHMNVRRNDLVDLMLDALKEDSEFNDKSASSLDDNIDKRKHKKELDDILIIATAMVFLVAGYDTTASAMSFTLYQLAMHPEIQEELREEIDSVLGTHEEEDIDYLDVDKFPLLDQVILETLRMYPLVPFLLRECTKSYAVPGTNVVLQPGDMVKISVTEIHNDEHIFEKPHIFNPRRFAKGDANDARHAMLTFGSGPRNCLGMRFALMEAKIGIAHILRRYVVNKCEKTVEKVTLDATSFVATNKEGLWVTLQSRA